MSLIVYGPKSIHSPRHVPSWLLLVLAAGCVNAGALIACRQFVTHVTGTSTLIGVDASRWWLKPDYLIILGSFIAGSMASVLALGYRSKRGLAPLYATPLLVVAGLLFLVAGLGHGGTFGSFGTEMDEGGDFLMLTILSFAMGLQNASVATTTGLIVRTAHVTGTATDLGIQLGTALISEGEERDTAVRYAGLRAAQIVTFIAGGVVMFPVAGALGYGAFALPAVFVLIATAASFMPSQVGVARAIRDARPSTRPAPMNP